MDIPLISRFECGFFRHLSMLVNSFRTESMNFNRYSSYMSAVVHKSAKSALLTHLNVIWSDTFQHTQTHFCFVSQWPVSCLPSLSAVSHQVCLVFQLKCLLLSVNTISTLPNNNLAQKIIENKKIFGNTAS